MKIVGRYLSHSLREECDLSWSFGESCCRGEQHVEQLINLASSSENVNSPLAEVRPCDG